MRTNLLLSLGGAMIGMLLTGLVYLVDPGLFKRLAVGPGATFNSIDDLRKAMTQRDGRDELADGSVSLRSIVQPNPSDQIIYELQPNISAKFRGVPVKTNKFGMRDREDITLEKPPGTYRIAVLGDSYAFGWGVEQDKPFPILLEKDIAPYVPAGLHPQVLNFGVPGYVSFQEVAQFLETGKNFNPDAVLVYFINNDFGLPFFIRDLEGDDASVLRGAPDFDKIKLKPDEKAALERRKKLLDSLDANKALIKLAQYCKEKNIRLFLSPHPDHTAAAMVKRLWVLRKAPEKDYIQLLWLNTDYDNAVAAHEGPVESLSIPHDNHPGAGAHKIIAEVLAKQLGQHLWNNPALEPSGNTNVGGSAE